MLLLLAIIAAGTGGVRHCSPASIGPGSLRRGGTAGATCLLSSFQNGCRAADYTLSSFGVDTVRARKFQVEHRNGRCAVLVTDSNRVIPQPPRILARRTCSRVHRLKSDIVADSCATHETVSLTKIG